MTPRYPSMPWVYEAVGTAEWTGTPLRHLLERAGLLDDVVEIAFIGADRGFDRGHEHAYGRSLTREVALGEDVLAVWAMNGAPLLPQHGYPLRLIVPGWYGMASVKWLNRIEALAQPYDGYQQVSSYMYRAVPGGPTTPVTHMRVEVAAGAAWHSRFLLAPAHGGCGANRALRPRLVRGRRGHRPRRGRHRRDLARRPSWKRPQGKFAWRGWRFTWDARARRARAVLPRHRRQRRDPAAAAALGHRRLRQQRRAARPGHGAMSGMDGTIEVSLWRGKADGGYQTYAVPLRENQTVLDVVTWVQRHADPTLAYRFACRVGMCGSCAMTVNGRPRWTCRTHVSQRGGGRPAGDRAARQHGRHQGPRLRHGRLLREMAEGEGRLRAEQDAARADREDCADERAAPRRRCGGRMHQLRCVLCGLRHGALERGLSGPGGPQPRLDALNDVRDAGNRERLAAVAANGGCHACHSHQSCQEHCPKALNPTASIAGLKRRTMQAYIRGEL